MIVQCHTFSHKLNPLIKLGTEVQNNEKSKYISLAYFSFLFIEED